MKNDIIESGIIELDGDNYFVNSICNDTNLNNLKRKLSVYYKNKFNFGINIIFSKDYDFLVKKGISKVKNDRDFNDYYVHYRQYE